MTDKYIKAGEGKRYVLTAKGLQKEYVRELFSTYPMYKHKVPGKWILNGYVEEENEDE